MFLVGETIIIIHLLTFQIFLVVTHQNPRDVKFQRMLTFTIFGLTVRYIVLNLMEVIILPFHVLE